MNNYSEKVLEHFKNPKNLGEMKNPDAVGTKGNPYCILPFEKVHTDLQNIEISQLNKHDNVLTHSGDCKKIILTSKKRYRGKIILLKNKLGTIRLTPEHLVYALKIPFANKYQRNLGKRQIVPAWYHSEDLKKGDIVLYPITKTEKEKEYLDINIKKSKYDFKSKEIPKRIELTEDLLKLFGYFLSEGNIQDKPTRTYISFALHINEKDIVDEIKRIVKKLFGLDIKIREKPEVKTTVVYLYSAHVARWFKELFGNLAEHKKINKIIMDLPPEKQKSIIYSLWKGDGYVNLNRDGARAGFCTISYDIAQQMKILLLRQKIVPSIYLDKARKIKGVNHKTSYRIHVGQRDSLVRLCKILKISYKPKSYESIKSWFDNNYLYTPITDKKELDYNGMVHNLEVEQDHSFISEAFSLHNCGDVMKIYLKIDKKSNKIKDIKFQTLGCAAAIATSSMITELAKGKTLEEAKKISNKDVADALGNLPPIKMHCSNLAADALRDAIENWEKK